MLDQVSVAAVSTDILNMVYLCRHLGLPEVADYWESVVALNTWQRPNARLVVEKLFAP